jgi:carboxypeptidase C (cathepsin A)
LPVLTASLLGLVPCSAAQGSLPDVQYDHVLRSPINPNITISYKTPSPEICRTTFKDQKQYTGYVHLPSSTLEPYRQDYSINTFFWFIEARQAPEQAPLTIYLNGGPGGSSMTSLFLENGPCELVPRDEDGYYRTVPRPWGWDRSSNILYIDQPTHVGFSYADSDHFLDQMTTQNTSQIAASATWHFLQGFLAAFPQYNPGVRPDSPKYYPAGIHLFAESYGGHYGPAFANFFGAQNEKRQYGEISSNSTLEINLESLGILNGLVDVAIQAEFWPKFAYNNSYGIQAITRTAELDALGHNQSCVEHVEACRYLHAEYDSDGEGDLGAVNDVCMLATASCKPLENVIYATDRSATDIRKRADPDSEYFSVVAEYLSNATVMQSIGARVKFTETSYTVYIAFSSSKSSASSSEQQTIANLSQLATRCMIEWTIWIHSLN